MEATEMLDLMSCWKNKFLLLKVSFTSARPGFKYNLRYWSVKIYFLKMMIVSMDRFYLKIALCATCIKNNCKSSIDKRSVIWILSDKTTIYILYLLHIEQYLHKSDWIRVYSDHHINVTLTEWTGRRLIQNTWTL